MPLARHGVGPDSLNDSRIVKTSKPKTRRDTDAEIAMMKLNGEKMNSASKARWPMMPKSSNPKRRSSRAPNWTELLVTAK